MGICKLCKTEKTLLTRSHIIPDFVYRDFKLYDVKHIVRVVGFDSSISDKTEVSKQITGEYEGNILCSDCDNIIFGQLENYAKKALFGGQLSEDESPKLTNYFDSNGINFSKVEKIDYKKMKLFILSIVWRASISSRPIFKNFKLDDLMEEKLRTMLLNGDPGEINDFPIYSSTYRNDSTMPKDIVLVPILTELDGFKIAKLFFGGLFIMVHISTGNLDKEKIKDSVLNKSNEWIIIHEEKGTGWDVFLIYANIK